MEVNIYINEILNIENADELKEYLRYIQLLDNENYELTLMILNENVPTLKLCLNNGLYTQALKLIKSKKRFLLEEVLDNNFEEEEPTKEDVINNLNEIRDSVRNNLKELLVKDGDNIFTKEMVKELLKDEMFSNDNYFENQLSEKEGNENE